MTHARIRLPHAIYRLPNPVSVTICVRDRKPVFKDATLARACLAMLHALSEKHDVPVYAFCFMPDHLHLLLAAAGRVDVVRFVGMWKGASTRLGWKHGLHGRWWQPRFFDHVLRGDEDIRDCARYVLNNPVRAGLVEDWRAYPYCGSFVFKDL